MNTVWILLLENYEGANFVEAYATKAKAIEAMRGYFNNALEDRENSEFEWDEAMGCCSWFNPEINEFNTYLNIFCEEF